MNGTLQAFCCLLAGNAARFDTVDDLQKLNLDIEQGGVRFLVVNVIGPHACSYSPCSLRGAGIAALLQVSLGLTSDCSALHPD